MHALCKNEVGNSELLETFIKDKITNFKQVGVGGMGFFLFKCDVGFFINLVFWERRNIILFKNRKLKYALNYWLLKYFIFPLCEIS